MPQHSPHDRYELVCQTSRGSIAQCTHCAALRLQFGNVILGLHQDDVPQLLSVVAGLDTPQGQSNRQSRLSEGTEDARSCEQILYLGESGVGMVFTPDELAELRTLLQRAVVLLTVASNDTLPTPRPSRRTARRSRVRTIRSIIQERYHASA